MHPALKTANCARYSSERQGERSIDVPAPSGHGELDNGVAAAASTSHSETTPRRCPLPFYDGRAPDIVPGAPKVKSYLAEYGSRDRLNHIKT